MIELFLSLLLLQRLSRMGEDLGFILFYFFYQRTRFDQIIPLITICPLFYTINQCEIIIFLMGKANITLISMAKYHTYVESYSTLLFRVHHFEGYKQCYIYNCYFHYILWDSKFCLILWTAELWNTEVLVSRTSLTRYSVRERQSLPSGRSNYVTLKKIMVFWIMS